MKAAVGIGEVRLYDIDPGATRKTLDNLRNSGLDVISCNSAEDAIEGAQIVTTCTADKAYATILTDNMVGAGIHINAIGGDRSEEHTSELQSLMRISYAVFCLKNKTT